MILDSVPFTSLKRLDRWGSDAILAFIQKLERTLGALVVYDARALPLGRQDLLRELSLAEQLLRHGILKSLRSGETFPDDPPFKIWTAECANEAETSAGGTSFTSDAEALMATLAEVQERYLWKEADDYYKRPVRASVNELKKRGKRFVDPNRFASYSASQRKASPRLAWNADTPFLWIEGLSMTTKKAMLIPVQTVSGKTLPQKEPPIRFRSTSGLASWPTRTGAQLAGAMECIERDAYMIMWLNQLSLPKLAADDIRGVSPALERMIASCERYRLRVHLMPMLTDAPAWALCVVLEDLSGEVPRFSIGLRAHRSLAKAAEKAILEALRGHRSGRRLAAKGPWDSSTPVESIGHYDRVQYWTEAEHAEHLRFLIQGKISKLPLQPWEYEEEEQHLQRVIEWCQKKDYEYVTVPMTQSKKNVMNLHVEMSLIPELQQMHLFESDKMLGGDRLREIPTHFGMQPRDPLYTHRPHPFA